MEQDYFESDEFQNILKTYEDSLSENKPLYLDSDDFIDVSDYYLQNRMFPQALKCVQNALSLHPNNAVLHGNKVNALINLDKYKEAIKCLEQLNPDDNFDYYYYKAQLALIIDDDRSTADEFFNEWINHELHDINLPPLNSHTSHDLSSIDYERLCADFLHIIASFSELADWLFSQPFISKWVKIYLQYCSPLRGIENDIEIASICHESGLIELEEQLYTQFLDYNPYLSEGWTYLASLQHSNGKYQEAIDSSNFALAIEPDDTSSLLLRGNCYYMLANYKLAIKDYIKYEHITESDINAQIIGKCLMLLGYFDEGHKYLQRSIKYINKNHKKNVGMRAMVLSFIAQAYLDGKFYDEALDSINQALALVPDITEFDVQKAKIYLSTGNLTEAHYWFHKSLETTTLKVPLLINIAREYLFIECYNEALEFVELAKEQTSDSQHVEAYSYLTFIFYMLGDKAKYLENLELACQHAPEIICSFWKETLTDVPQSEYFNILKKIDFSLKK
ncbi:MAG: tetratricopeptide repeat protein [Prevotellaceae bacterium]|nr:tetratricopeptide repeat protein [Candidatus Colivivens equi]